MSHPRTTRYAPEKTVRRTPEPLYSALSDVVCYPSNLRRSDETPGTSNPTQASQQIGLNPTMAVATATYAVPLPERLSDGDFQVYR